jgi:hypothetical protein
MRIWFMDGAAFDALDILAPGSGWNLVPVP